MTGLSTSLEAAPHGGDQPAVMMNMRQALNDALLLKLEADNRVCLMGEDIGAMGGFFGVTAGLQKEFGTERVFDSRLVKRRWSEPQSEWRSSGCGPSPDGGVVGGQAAVAEKFLDVTIGERKPQIPSNRTGDHGRFEVAPFEQRWP